MASLSKIGSLATLLFLLLQVVAEKTEKKSQVNPLNDNALEPEHHKEGHQDHKKPVEKPFFDPWGVPTKYCSRDMNSRNVSDALGHDAQRCSDDKEDSHTLSNLDCKMAFYKMNVTTPLSKIKEKRVKLPNVMIGLYGSCNVTLKSTMSLNSPALDDMWSTKYGMGITAMIDTCCPMGFWWHFWGVTTRESFVDIQVGPNLKRIKGGRQRV